MQLRASEAFYVNKVVIAEFTRFNWRLRNIQTFTQQTSHEDNIILRLFALIVVPIPSVCYWHIRPECEENCLRWGEEKSIKKIKQRRTIIDGFSTVH